MSIRCVLVSFPAVPYNFDTLLPDSLLAGIAGSLLDAGHRPAILDYATVETLDRFFPAQVRRASLSLADQMLDETPSGSLKTLAAFLKMRGMGASHRSRQQGLRRTLADEAANEISAMSGVTMVVLSVRQANDLGNAVYLAGRIRQAVPGAVLVAAGAFIEHYGELLARQTRAFDVLCLAEPEFTMARFAEVVERREMWTDAPNLAIVSNGTVRLTRQKKVDLNNVALPDYSTDVYPALEGDSKFKVLGLTCTRVCSQQCPACPHAELQPGLSRPLSPKAVCQALAQAVNQQNVCAFNLQGPAFSEPYATALACEMLTRGLAVFYTRNASIRETRVGNLTTYKASGCQALSFGVDSGSQWLLEDYYRRGFSVSQAEKVLGSAVASGMFTVARFTYPCPADDYHTHAETLRLLERTRPGSALFELPHATPGSEWFSRADEYGFKMDLNGFFHRAIDRDVDSELPLSEWRTLLHARRQITLSRAVAEQEQLCSDVRHAGISTSVTSDLALVARVSGYEGHEQDFATLMRRRFFTGDVAGIADAAARFNQQASMPAKRGAMPLLAVAGN